MLNPNLIKIKNQTPFIVEMMYAVPENISGIAAYKKVGFGAEAYVHKTMWEALQKIIPLLQEQNLRLKIKDAYRPPVAHELLLKAVPIPGLFAVSPEASQHCHGTAIDVLLCDEQGKELEFQCPVDCYTPYFASEIQQGRSEEYKEFLQKARHDYPHATKQAEANREKLRQIMQVAGLETIPHEWWHYNLPDGKSEKFPMLDF